MRDRLEMALRISSAALVLAGYLALASVRVYGNAVLLVPLVVFPLVRRGERLDTHHPGYRVLSKAVIIAYLCFIPLTVAVLGLMDAVIVLIIFVQAFTLLHRKETRNYLHLYLMAFFLLLAACVQSPEPFIAVVLLLFLLSAIWAFLTLRLHDERQRAGTLATADILELGETHQPVPIERADPLDRGLVTAVSAVSVMALLMTAAIFFLTPRIEAGFLGRDSNEITVTGLSESVDLTSNSPIFESETPVMRVEFPEEPGGRLDGVPLYWRSSTLPRLLGTQWLPDQLRQPYEPEIRSLYPTRERHLRRGGASVLRRQENKGARRIHQVIYMDDVPEEGVPCLDLVQRIESKSNAQNAFLLWDDSQDVTVNLNTRGARRLRYEVWSEVIVPSPETLRGVNNNYSTFLATPDYPLLTHQDLLPQTRELARRVTQRARTPYDQARAIEAWLSGNEFEYTLDLPPLPRDYPIDFFLSETKRGHCQLFASAMALLLRSLGVPARLVSGYRGGDWNESDQSYTVRASMAHMWVEVLFPGHGWVVFDPSPQADGGTLSGFQRLANSFSAGFLKAKMLWYQEVVGFDRSTQLARLKDFSLSFVRSLWAPGESGSVQTGIRSLGTRVPLLAALTIVSGAWVFYRLRRRRPRTALLTEDQARAVLLYKKAQRHLTRRGLTCDGKTAEELMQELHQRQWEELYPLLTTYNAVRFGKRPLPKTRYDALRRQLRSWRPEKAETA